MRTRPGILVLLIAVILLALPRTVAAERRFASVQAGPHASAVALSAYAPGRVVIRLTPEAAAALDVAAWEPRGERGPEALAARMGLARLAARLEVRAVVRLHERLRDTAASADAERVLLLRLPASADIPAACALLTADPAVEFAVPDRRVYPAVTPNDPFFAANWGHRNTAQLPAYDWYVSYDHTLAPVGQPGFDADTDLAWDFPAAYGAGSVIIAILDSGVDPTHADLWQLPGYDFGDNDANPADDIPGVAGHGTCCAGVAAAVADNATGAVGVAGGCPILPLKVGDSAGNLYLSYVAQAVYHAVNAGAAVISMSFSTPGIMSDPLLDPALAYAANAGVVLVAAAGNDNMPVLDYPANHPDVIAVGAASPCGERKRSSADPADLAYGVLPDVNGYTCDGERWWGSNFGSPGMDAPDALDLLAPTMLPTTDITGAAGYRAGDVEPFFNGTSCSAPFVAGVCALVLSAHPALPPQQVRDILRRTCTDVVSVESTPGWDRWSGHGLVNARAAVLAAVTPAALFAASTVGGCQPLTVGFTDLSGGLITQWQWDYGDGSPPESIPNPLHIYHQPGTYTVTLTVTGPYGTDTLALPDLITVDPLPTADFTAGPLSGDYPLSVDFTDASGGGVDGWQWDFGDGGHADEPNPTHVYAAPGLYTVSLAVGNPCGGDVKTREAYIEVTDPASGAPTVPRRFALAPPRPNPFNPATELAFELAAEGPASLAIHDAAGRRVAVLVDAVLPAGPHRVAWRASGRPSGVYFARLRAGDRTAVRRLVLLR